MCKDTDEVGKGIKVSFEYIDGEKVERKTEEERE